MRDADRIYPFCNEIAAKWSEVQDWRFGQLMMNFFSWIQDKTGADPFYIEDDKMMEYFKEFMG